MLYYLIICFFVVGNCASVQEVLGPDSNVFKSLINAATSTDIGYLNKNETATSLLSQVLSVNPKDIGLIVTSLTKLVKQAEKEISTLDGLLKSSTENLEKTTTADKNAQYALDQRKSETKIAIKKEKSAVEAKQTTKAELGKAEQHHKEMKDRFNSEKPVLQNQLKVLKEVIALLVPISSSKCPENSIKYELHCYATLDYKNCNYDMAFRKCNSTCDDTFKLIPDGWEIAPDTNKIRTDVIGAHSFGTHLLLLSNGNAIGNLHYHGIIGKLWNKNQLKQIGKTYKALNCNLKILIRTI